MRPVGHVPTDLVKNFVLWRVEQREGNIPNTDCGDVAIEPASYQAQFCVSAEPHGNPRLLEQDARLVTFAAEAVDRKFLRAQPRWTFLVPVILTTARLYTLRFQPDEVSLNTGEFSNLDIAQIEKIRWVRFHKTFTARSGNYPRTVFVVNAETLPAFMTRAKS